MPPPYRLAGRYHEPWLDTAGNRQPTASVAVYLAGTTTFASLYTSAAKATAATNPVTATGTGSRLDGLGNLTIFADPGVYDTVTTVGGVSGPVVTITVYNNPDEVAQLGADGKLLAGQAATAGSVADGSITTAKLADGAVTDVKVASGIAQAKVTGLTSDLDARALTTDSRFTDQRVPTDGSVTDAKVATGAAIAESKLALASDAAAGVASRRTLGTGATQAAPGNDARLSDQRVPTDNSVSTAKLVDGAVTAIKVAADVATQAELDAHAATAHGSSLTVQDEGAALATAADTLNFVGAGVTATGTTGTKTITVPGAASANIARATTIVTVVNTTTETELVRLAIPTTVGAGDLLSLLFGGEMFNNSGAAVNWTWKVKIGATTVLDSGLVSVASSANRRKYVARSDVVVVAPATSQRMTGTLLGTPGATTSFATFQVAGSLVGTGTAAEDLTVAKDIVVTVTHGTAGTNIETTMLGAHLLHFKV